jgi:dye decolorizing peroxidase
MADSDQRGPSRRSVLGIGATLVGGAGVGLVGYEVAGLRQRDDAPSATTEAADTDRWAKQAIPFHGTHQSGITTAPQAHATFIALNLLPGAGKEDLRRLLRMWSDDANRLQSGTATLADPQPDIAGPPSRLTITVGLGIGALRAAGLADQAPAWLGPLPAYSVDRLQPAWSDGDVVAQVCAEDPIVLAHAVRALLIDATGIAALHWQQKGFRRPVTSTTAMRNLMGQVDGTVQPADTEYDQVVWIAEEGPAWLRGGSALVLRRIRMDLDTWDRLDPAAKESAIGRRLGSGAPLTGTVVTDTPDLEATVNGLHVIPDFAHVRHAKALTTGEKILRRPYNYDETPLGSSTSEAGLLFAAYQRNPREQFAVLQQRMDGKDLLNVWTTPIGSAVFAMLPGVAEGEYLGRSLLG